jgi:hypothetical protein
LAYRRAAVIWWQRGPIYEELAVDDDVWMFRGERTIVTLDFANSEAVIA